jgi:hypothetical protein
MITVYITRQTENKADRQSDRQTAERQTDYVYTWYIHEHNQTSFSDAPFNMTADRTQPARQSPTKLSRTQNTKSTPSTLGLRLCR